MGLLRILSVVTKKKMNMNPKDLPVQKTDTPLGMHQGSSVTLPGIDLALAQTDGSLIPDLAEIQYVSAVGTYELWGLKFYNVYLGEGTSFIRLACNAKGAVKQAVLFASRDEILPQSNEDWEFWLGSYQRDNFGQFLRDSSGVALRKDWGLIGWNQFQVDGPPAIVYNREWSQGPEGVEPIAFVEVIRDNQGNLTKVQHEAMEYSRRLTDAADAVTESLLTTVVQDTDGASINIFVGVPLDHQAIQVLRS